MVLESEADTVRAQHRRCPCAVAVDDLADPCEQVDVEVVREPAGGRQLVRGRADAAGEADDGHVATRECVPGERDVLGRGPPPVEVPEPQVDRVEPEPGDPREQVVETACEGLDRLVRRVRRVVERPPLVRGAVAELLGDVVRAHERDEEGTRCRVHWDGHLST